MKIIGAGLSRTGTMTMRFVLDKLGFPCYHMEIAVRNFERGDLDQWIEFLEGRSKMDWKALFDGYEATMDAPACFFYRELMEEFPDAKVILTVREPEKWYESAAKLRHLHNTMVEKLRFVPRFKAFQRVYRSVEKILIRNGDSREALIAAFEAHNQAVKAAVPPERLLIFDARDGYAPLCKFLGVPVPDEPFPHMNSGIAQVDRLIKKMLMQDLLKIYGPWLLGIIVVVILLIILL